MTQAFAKILILFGTTCALAITQASAAVVPVRESAYARTNSRSAQPLKLALKHFPQSGKQPVLLLHGLAQNDRIWDSPIQKYSFARALHAEGFDVWVANFRGAGTPGFRSEAPAGPRHWTVEDYAALDLPALVARVFLATGKTPFIVGHSMAAWALDGYFAGLEYDSNGKARVNALRAKLAQKSVKGVVTIGGIYNVWWPHSIHEAVSNPILSEKDYYQSNYELEALAQSRPLFELVPRLPALPLDWIGGVLFMPLDRIPFVGSWISNAYRGFQQGVIRTPVFNMFYNASNVEPEVVREHVRDGMDDLGPKLIEQLGNAVRARKTMVHYHGEQPPESSGDAYAYESVRGSLRMPYLLIAGDRDRCANSEMIFRDGYLKIGSPDKTYLRVEDAGHLDIIEGKRAPEEVIKPVARWLKERT